MDREYLISRMLDGDLSADEMTEARHRRATDEEFRARMDEWSRVDELLREWGTAQPDVNWESFGASVMREVHRGRELRLHRAGDGPEVARSARRRSMGLLLRIAGPLAAAAVLVIAVGLPLRQAQQARHESRQWVRVDVARPITLAQTSAPGGKGTRQVRVQFARGASAATEETEGPRRLMIGAIARVDDRGGDGARDGVF